MFSIHVVEESEAVGGWIGDTVRVFRRHVEKWTYKPGLVPFLAWPRCLDVHVETLKHTYRQQIYNKITGLLCFHKPWSDLALSSHPVTSNTSVFSEEAAVSYCTIFFGLEL